MNITPRNIYLSESVYFEMKARNIAVITQYNEVPIYGV